MRHLCRKALALAFVALSATQALVGLPRRPLLRREGVTDAQDLLYFAFRGGGRYACFR